MNFEQFYTYCMQKPYVTEHFPFDQDTLVFKVGNKMFALTSVSEWENGTPAVNLKCNPDKCIELREQYEGIEPGWHMNKTHWNTVSIWKDVDSTTLQSLIDLSYQLILNSLPKKQKMAMGYLNP